MSYQKCPVCDGTGLVSGGYFLRGGDAPNWSSASATDVCRVCSGTGIIDKDTGGLPPRGIANYKDKG